MENERIRAGDRNAVEEKPPIFKTWRRLYTAVLLNLALLIVLFYLFTKAFD
ncbi:MAG: hypothetical protein MUP70_03730 [Candidatus Aminicenantes bacterium]|nr:hypothetical protein [Candidatus Aminicenantes bacterium]